MVRLPEVRVGVFPQPAVAALIRGVKKRRPVRGARAQRRVEC